MNFGVDSIDIPVIQTPTVISILDGLGSGIGLDIAKNHTGVCIYTGDRIIQQGFRLQEYDKNDVHAEYKMRKDLKCQLGGILNGLSVEHCVVEDVYGGENFDTVRKLLALNTVIDELIDEGVVRTRNFYRWSETRWLKYFRRFYKFRGGLKSKIETQKILEYLRDTFYLENINLSSSKKLEIFFEDICDATAMLCSVSTYLKEKENMESNINISIKDIRMFYIEDWERYLTIPDDRIGSEGWTWVEPEYRSLDKKIIDEVVKSPNDIFIMEVPVKKLGRFGIEHKFEFFPSGCGYLIWYYLRK